MKKYFIKESYRPRTTLKYCDDTSNTDGWQKEVYMFAKTMAIKNGFSRIADIGTGSGYKLIKNFLDMDLKCIELYAKNMILKHAALIHIVLSYNCWLKLELLASYFT